MRELFKKKLIFIILKVNLVGSWKSLIILTENREPSGKYLRVWAKNQLRFEIFEKLLKFKYENLNGKLIFYPFSLRSSWTFSTLYSSIFQLWKTTLFSPTFFGFGGLLPSPSYPPVLINYNFHNCSNFKFFLSQLGDSWETSFEKMIYLKNTHLSLLLSLLLHFQD